MSSEVEISNLALSHLGDNATVSSIDPPEGSPQAEHCAQFWPVARDVVLSMHQWGFATKRVTLAALEVDSWGWSYAYALPSGCLKVLSVLPYESSSDDETQPYETEVSADGTPIILTNTSQATCRYVWSVTDSARFPPLVAEAMSRLLASYLAGPVVKGEAGRKTGADQLALFNIAIGRAMVADANQRDNKPTHTPAWIGVR